MSHFRCRWPSALLLGALVLSLGCRGGGREGENVPLSEADRAEAARMLVAWSLQGKHPDVDREDAPIRRAGHEDVLLLCEFLPHDEALTLDPGVNRVAREQWQRVRSRPDPGVVLLHLSLDSEGPDALRLSVTAAGAGDDGAGPWQWGRAFEVRRARHGLKARFTGVITR